MIPRRRRSFWSPGGNFEEVATQEVDPGLEAAVEELGATVAMRRQRARQGWITAWAGSILVHLLLAAAALALLRAHDRRPARVLLPAGNGGDGFVMGIGDAAA